MTDALDCWSCDRCIFWEEDGAAAAACGLCRRNPPAAGDVKLWPTTRASHYCGGFIDWQANNCLDLVKKYPRPEDE